MRLKLGQYAKRVKKSRYEVLRLIMQNKISYEEVVEDGKKVYYILVDENDLINTESDMKKTEYFQCGDVVIEIDGDYLKMTRNNRVETYKKVERE